MKILSYRRRAALLLGGGAIALAACGSESTSSSSTAAAGCPSGQEQVSSTVSGGSATTSCVVATDGGIMNIGSPQEPSSFLAAGITDSMTFSYAVDAGITEGLLWYRSVDETTNAKTLADYWQPWLATEVPTTDNGDVKTSGCPNADAKMCVTWKLRDGVTWHDGTKFSSADVCETVAFFFTKYKDKNPTAILSSTGWDQMLDCKKDSALQATIDFKSIYSPYLGLLTGVYGVMPAKYLDVAFATNADLEKTAQTIDLTSANPGAFKGTDTLDNVAVGTGPFVLQVYNKTKDIKLLPNQHYWGPKPHLSGVDFHFVADVQSQLASTKAGELEFGMDYRLAFLKDLQTAAQAGKIAVETIPESGAEKIDLNLCDNANGLCGADAKKSPITADVKFRKALLEGINRQSIVDNIAAGATKIPQDGWHYLGAEYAKPALSDDPITAYDPTKAAADLDAAGYKISTSCHGGQGRAAPSGACVDLDFVTTSGNPARAQAQVAIQSDLQKLGIFTNTSTIKAGKLFGNFSDGGVLYTHAFQMAMYTNTLSVPAELDSYYPGYVSTQIPSKANSGQGQNDTGEDNPQVDKDFNDARLTTDLAKRTTLYKDAISQMAKDLQELPLYQQVTVNSYTTKLKGLQRNDLVWTFNIGRWFCTGGNCTA